jgi:hypothetical protein
MSEPLSLTTARSFDELVNDMMMKNTREWVQVTAGFVLQGRKSAEIGEKMQVSRSFAAELIACGKAERIDPPGPRPQAETDPHFIPQIDPAAAEAARIKADADAAAAAGGKKK